MSGRFFPHALLPDIFSDIKNSFLMAKPVNQCAQRPVLTRRSILLDLLHKGIGMNQLMLIAKRLIKPDSPKQRVIGRKDYSACAQLKKAFVYGRYNLVPEALPMDLGLGMYP